MKTPSAKVIRGLRHAISVALAGATEDGSGDLDLKAIDDVEAADKWLHANMKEQWKEERS